jgi:broad-specificity NMP kinase
MGAYLITGNPGSGKSALAAELSRRSLIAVDGADLAFWEDSAGMRVDQPPEPDDDWRLAHRWVWSRARLEQCIAGFSGDAGRMFLCGTARNQTEMLDLFEQVFLLMIDDETQMARLKSPARTGFACCRAPQAGCGRLAPSRSLPARPGRRGRSAWLPPGAATR